MIITNINHLTSAEEIIKIMLKEEIQEVDLEITTDAVELIIIIKIVIITLIKEEIIIIILEIIKEETMIMIKL